MNITKRPEFKEKFVEQSQDVFKVMSKMNIIPSENVSYKRKKNRAQHFIQHQVNVQLFGIAT